VIPLTPLSRRSGLSSHYSLFRVPYSHSFLRLCRRCPNSPSLDRPLIPREVSSIDQDLSDIPLLCLITTLYWPSWLSSPSFIVGGPRPSTVQFRHPPCFARASPSKPHFFSRPGRPLPNNVCMQSPIPVYFFSSRKPRIFLPHPGFPRRLIFH